MKIKILKLYAFLVMLVAILGIEANAFATSDMRYTVQEGDNYTYLIRSSIVLDDPQLSMEQIVATETLVANEIGRNPIFPNEEIIIDGKLIDEKLAQVKLYSVAELAYWSECASMIGVGSLPVGQVVRDNVVAPTTSGAEKILNDKGSTAQTNNTNNLDNRKLEEELKNNNETDTKKNIKSQATEPKDRNRWYIIIGLLLSGIVGYWWVGKTSEEEPDRDLVQEFAAKIENEDSDRIEKSN